jgi:phosphinothricin acetyltransferase
MGGDMIIREMEEKDREAVMKIFNYYAATSFAAYPEDPLPPQFFALLREGALSAIVLEGESGIAGFGLLKLFLPFPVFWKTGMLSYFIAPDATRAGLGSRLLERLNDEAKKGGMTMLVANMSSRNEVSICFHQRHGFSDAGTLHDVGEKFGEPFGILWMQRAVK